jgi:IS4 transposase
VERLAWCDWTILATNAPVEKLTPKEATVLYRTRWQGELLFKRWKSQGLAADRLSSRQ